MKIARPGNGKSVSVWQVARFEFMRYFKWKQELISLGILILLMVVFGSGGALMQAAKNREHFEVAVINDAGFELNYGERARLTLLRAEKNDRARLLDDVDAGRLDGLLELKDRDTGALTVNREPSWRKELDTALGKARLDVHLREQNITREQYDNWRKPVEIALDYSPNAKRPASSSTATLAQALVYIPMIGLFAGFALFFASITTEKQQRVSESIVSAIPHQLWIDGKLMGITGHSLKAVITIGLYGLTVVLGIASFSEDGASGLLSAISWPLIAQALVFALGGLLFWNSFMCAIAATIDDPNSSTRSSLMMIPMLFVMLTLIGVDAPENLMMKVLSWLPLSSMAAMPVRIAHGTVPVWEIIGSLTTLAAGFWGMRKMASRIFQAGMLFYGKEPSWGQIWQWVRHGHNM